ncbi:hypothetical protein V1478_004619, partial [Vespula squamosa]
STEDSKELVGGNGSVGVGVGVGEEREGKGRENQDGKENRYHLLLLMSILNESKRARLPNPKDHEKRVSLAILKRAAVVSRDRRIVLYEILTNTSNTKERYIPQSNRRDREKARETLTKWHRAVSPINCGQVKCRASCCYYGSMRNRGLSLLTPNGWISGICELYRATRKTILPENSYR